MLVYWLITLLKAKYVLRIMNSINLWWMLQPLHSNHSIWFITLSDLSQFKLFQNHYIFFKVKNSRIVVKLESYVHNQIIKKSEWNFFGSYLWM